MDSNWAEEFRRRVEETEGSYRPAENCDDVDDEDEDVELEEPKHEAEEESEEGEQEDEDEEETEDVEQEVEEPKETEEPETAKPPLRPVGIPGALLERQKFRWELDNIIGKADQATEREDAKAEAKRETNERANVGAAMMGLIVLSLMPTFYQTMMQAFQPIIQSFSSQSCSRPTASQQWVACSYCGYQCLGYNEMACPRCGRS